jgi:hypothetical protein
MITLEDKIVDTSVLIEKQLPSFVRESNPKFVSFLTSYYESQEVKYNSLDIAENLIEYYNIGHYNPKKLTEYTTLTSSVSNSATTITVLNTDGFPTSGYLQIGNEIIYYTSKSKTQFLNCVRNTGAFVLEKIPTTNVVYTSSKGAGTYTAQTKVYNIAQQFASEFLNRIKSEISPTIPENLAPELNLISFLKNISSFYRSKGTENSHKLLFRILFNERRVKLKLLSNGIGANIDILNYSGDISSYQISSAGSGYYYELSGGQLVAPPVIDIIGSGTGAINPLTSIATNEAKMIVTGMNSSGGITAVQVVNKGTGYVGPITARIRERVFIQDQVVNCVDSNNNVIGTGKVYSWSDSSRELILYQISGYFTANSKVIGVGGEQPRSRISAAYPVTQLNKEGNPSIEIIPNDPRVERPKESVIKPSSASYYERKVIRCELVSGATNLDKVTLLQLVQNRDLSYKIPGVTLEVSEIQKIDNNLYEFEIGDNLNYTKLYLSPSTTITQSATLYSNAFTNITVSSAKNFPKVNAKLFIDGRVVEYASRTDTQFINCKVVTGDSPLVVGNSSKVYLYGRTCSTSGSVNYFLTGYAYKNGVKVTTPITFKILGLPSEVKISDGGALYSSSLFKYNTSTTNSILKSKNYNFGSVDQVILENGGQNYKVNEKLLVDNTFTYGNGFTAYIAEISGVSIASYQYVTVLNENYIKVTTSQSHNLATGDLVIFNNSSIEKQRVFSVENSTQFLIPRPSGLTALDLNLTYTTTSKTASGSIVRINIASKGNNYKKLPEVIGVETANGSGALFQLNSNTIGKISSIQCESISGELVGDRKVQFNVKFPSTSKIKNNYQIAKIEVVSGGNNYRPTDKIKVNGVINNAYKFNIITSSGIITQIEVISGGSNLNSIPTITIESEYGTGATLKAKLTRKLISTNDELKFGSFANPTGVCKVVNFDSQSSVLEFEKLSGNINENDLVYLPDGSVYGNIFSIKTAVAYSTTSPYTKFPYKFLDNYGFLNDNTQRIHDSDFYQDWSYTIASTKNTSEWRNEVIQNTHPSGFKLFGKNLIENQKPLFVSQQDIFNSSVIFKATLANLLNLNIKLSECNTQKISIANYSAYSIGDFIYGNISGATGLIKEISESYIEVYLFGTTNFIVGEYVFEVTKEFAAFSNHESNNVFTFYSGILQKPVDSYYISNNNFIPKFSFTPTDEIIVQKLTNSFEVLEYQIVGNTLKLYKNNLPFVPTSVETILISINGVVQAPTYSVSNNIVTLSASPSSTDTIFVLHQPNLKVLTVSGSGTSYTINYSPASSCNLLLFANSVYQSQLVTDYSVSGNQVSLTETAPGLFGWYINETVTCYLLNGSILSPNQVLDVNTCDIKKFTQFIESNAVKNTKSLYQITKDLLDGTVYADPDNTTVYGYDSRFTYSNPEYSSSYVEVLNEITFNGSATTFNLRYTDGLPYTPINGKNTLLVYVNNTVLDQDQYSISGSTITFNQVYNSSSKATIIDFNSKYLANNTASKSANLDRLNVVQNSSRKTFNLSDRGVPQYVKNVGDLFVIKNGTLRRPDTQTHSVAQNKITFVDAPTASDNVKLCYFNRQLDPAKTKNVILDPFICFNGVRATFPISVDGILFSPISEHHLFVIRNSVYQKPTIDYTVSGTNITFTTPPVSTDEIFVYYSYDGLTQNFSFDSFRMYNGTQTTFSLTTNYISTTVYSASHLQVVRNGVYQYPSVDYTIAGASDARYINFVTPPSIADDITIVNYKSDDLVDVTSRFTQINTSSLQYTSQTPTIDTNVFLIYVNGILQVDNSWSFNSGTNVLTFNGFVSLTLDKVRILAFKTAKRTIDPILITAGNSTYNLQVGGSTISTNLPTKSSDLLVSLNGVEQLPVTAYTISGSTITLIDPNLPVGGYVYIYQIGSSTFDTEVVDYLDDNYSKFTYKLQTNYKSFNPPSASDLFVLRNGVAQNPTEDFISGNGYITFTTNITANDDIFIGYRHGSSEIGITNVSGTTVTLATSIPAGEYNNLVLHINGVPQFNQRHFTISGNTVTLSSSGQIDSIFAIKYATTTFIDQVEDCPNGSRTQFRLFYNAQNLIAADIAQNADILVSVNGVIQYPGVQYTLSANRGIIEFLTPPQFTDQIFMVRMNGNEVVNLTSVSGSNTVYNLDQSIPAQRQENLVVFSNNTWKFNELGEYTYNTNSRITLAAANTSTYVFAIKFAGTFHLLDQINTPYNGSNTKFNLFLTEQNFMPPGTVDNDVIPSESSLLVVKNGKILDPGVDFTLQGDIKSQIQFTVAPISTDIISVKCVGSFLKLLSITSGFGGKVYNLKKQNNTDYYPNSDISRPRPHENQVIVIRDGNIQSPLYDYYIDNNKLVFTNNVSASKLVIMDFRGTLSDVAVSSVSYQVNVGDKISIDGEQGDRIVSEVISPTVLKTTSYSGLKPSGFVATATTTSGKLTSISITNGGNSYHYPVILRTLGVGYGAKATASVNNTIGGAVQTPIDIQYPGYNQYAPQSVVPTAYAYAYKQRQLSTSNVKIGTKLASNITATAEIIPVANAQNFGQSDVVVSISSATGSGATFRPFVSNGRIRKVEVLTPGIGYDDRDVEVVLTGGGGSGCVLETILDGMGRVTSVIVRNSGEGYDAFRAIVDTDIIEYTNIVSNQLVGCTRVASATTHNQNDVLYYDKFI